MRSFLFAGALCVYLSGCADPATTPFEPAAAAFIHAEGKSIIEGHAFTINPFGNIVQAAGQRVFLVPATPYAKERFEALFLHERNRPPWIPDLWKSDPRYADYVRTTVAESDGKFRFDGLVPGTYILSTKATWHLENRLLPGGREMFATAMVTGNETEPVKVVIAGN